MLRSRADIPVLVASLFLVVLLFSDVNLVSAKNVSSTQAPLSLTSTKIELTKFNKSLVTNEPIIKSTTAASIIAQVLEAKTTLKPLSEPVTIGNAALHVKDVKSVQVTGFITKNGNIYEIDDADGIGVIEGRQTDVANDQITNICNYGSVVIYSDIPCDRVTNIRISKVPYPALNNQALSGNNAQEVAADQADAEEQIDNDNIGNTLRGQAQRLRRTQQNKQRRRNGANKKRRRPIQQQLKRRRLQSMQVNNNIQRRRRWRPTGQRVQYLNTGGAGGASGGGGGNGNRRRQPVKRVQQQPQRRRNQRRRQQQWQQQQKRRRYQQQQKRRQNQGQQQRRLQLIYSQ